MSHTTKIEGVSIKNEKAIRKAVENLKAKGINISLKENATPRMYYDAQEREVGKCEYVLHLPDAKYDVGLKKQADGSYTPIYDEYMGSVGKQIGGACKIPKTDEEKSLWGIGQFSQEYAKEAATMAAEAEGWYVQDTTMDEDGNVHLVLTQ